jgi:hypothetical protein
VSIPSTKWCTNIHLAISRAFSPQPLTHGSLSGEQEGSDEEIAKMVRISKEVQDAEWPTERGPWLLRSMEVDWPENVEAVEPKEALYMVLQPEVRCRSAWDLLRGVYCTRRLMYSKAQSPDVHTVVQYLYVCATCDLKIVFERCWIGNWGSRYKAIPKGGSDRSVCNIWLVKIELVMSVDQRHGTGIDEHLCLHLLYSCQSSRFLCDWQKKSTFVMNHYTPVYTYIFDAISECLFFLWRLKIKHMMELQVVHLFLNEVWSWTLMFIIAYYSSSSAQNCIALLLTTIPYQIFYPWHISFSAHYCISLL